MGLYEGMPEHTLQVFMDSESKGEYRDCAVKALAIAAEWEYAEAHAALRKLGRRDRKGTKKGLVESALNLAGYSITEIPLRRVRAKTVTTIERDTLFKYGVFIVRTAGHVLCVRDGMPLDWTNGRRHRIKAVFQVEPINVSPQLKDDLVGCLDTAVKAELQEFRDKASYCTRCQLYLPVERFSKDRSRKNGLDTWCKQCTKQHRLQRAACK